MAMGMGTRFLLLLVFTIFQSTPTLTGALHPYSTPGFLFVRTRGRCTPRYWSTSSRESWPKMVPETSTVAKVFGSRTLERYRRDLTLVEAAAAEENGDVFGRVVKEATAALVNSYARKGYPYAPWEVKTLLIQSLVSEEAAALQAEKFLEANENCG